MNNRLTMELIDTSSHTMFEACLAIYRESFPDHEKQPETVIADRLINGVATLYAGIRDGVPVCIAIIHHLRDLDGDLLDYFAVSPNGRGEGIGSAFLQIIFDLLRMERQSDSVNPERQRYLLIEVEHPDFGDNKKERNNRIRFYQKAGAVLLGSRYLLPPLGSAKHASEMRLMIFPGNMSNLTSQSLKKIISAIYTQVYGRMLSDPHLKLLIDLLR
ncbi:MAG: hypothetical protein EOO02_19970 [Chitinophagaceae bacterium]|nr:MAG: hypothetical protein EOO02_19970 [Chitinophagaceae bacterium]